MACNTYFMTPVPFTSVQPRPQVMPLRTAFCLSRKKAEIRCRGPRRAKRACWLVQGTYSRHWAGLQLSGRPIYIPTQLLEVRGLETFLTATFLNHI